MNSIITRAIHSLAIIPAIAAGVSLLVAGDASGQINRSGNNSQRSGTIGRNNNTGFGNSGLGGGFGQAGFGQGGFAQAGLGGGGIGQGGMGQRGFGGGQQFGAGGRQQNRQGFVGRDADDRRQNFEAMERGNQGRRGMFDMMMESLDDMRRQRRRWESRNRQPPPALVSLKPDFAAPAMVSAGAPAPVIQSRLSETMSMAGAAAPQVRMEGRTAVLIGSVATEHQRRLAEKLVSIEPGVSEVQNQLTVDSPDDGSSSSSVPNR